MTLVTNLESEQMIILLFLAAAGVASVVSHCLVRKYIVASFAASCVATLFTMVCLVAPIFHLPPMKFSWIPITVALLFICAIPISLFAGVPFLLTRRWTSSRRPENDARIFEDPNGARAGLSLVLCALVLWSVASHYQQEKRDKIDNNVYEAARNGTPTDIQAALNLGGNVDTGLEYGTTPLMIASFYGRTQNVAFLLKKGANVNVVCPGGETALNWAKQNKHEDVVKLLRGAGATR